MRFVDRPVYFSFINFAACALASYTATSENANYPATNLGSPNRPGLPWKSTGATQQRIVIDFGAPRPVGVVGLFRSNFTDCEIQGSAAGVWSNPWRKVVTIGRNPVTSRYQAGELLTNFTFRYLSLLIPEQTPLDGQGVFSLGGIWAGQLTPWPKNPLFAMTIRKIVPRRDIQPEHQGWRQRLVLGMPIAQLAMQRAARVGFPQPITAADDLVTWFDTIDRQVDAAGFVLVHLNTPDASQAYIVRPVEQSEWPIARKRYAMSPYTLEEVVGP